jgi:uncharacterized protein
VKGSRSRVMSSRLYAEVEAKMSGGGDFKNNDLHPIDFDRGGIRHYYTRPMAPGLPDRVDFTQLADDAAVLERVYPLDQMSRLQDVLADAQGSVRARFVFAKVASGRAGVAVAVEGAPQLVCQRCLQGFTYAVAVRSDIEFSIGFDAAEAAEADSQREIYAMGEGLVSLRELAEEELLLALPMAPMHAPQSCRTIAIDEAADEGQGQEKRGGQSRPFAALQNLLKKT